MELGPHLRAARTRRGLTIAELAAAAGLSKGFVSQVENDKTSPSLDTLERLAAALDLAVVDLLRGIGEPPPAPYVVPGALLGEEAVPARRRPAGGRLILAAPAPALPAVREISAPGALVRSFVVQLPPGTALGAPGHHHDGEESLVVLRGVVEAEQAGTRTRLAAGDALTWTAGQPHRLLNRSPEAARLLITLLAPATLGPAGVVGSPTPRPTPPLPEARPLRLIQMRAARRSRQSSVVSRQSSVGRRVGSRQ
ncbi:MAG TPA: helix-turn-helix domain-containing protein [Chloroflexia bacterium]|nr:helix-turn-helix domain-containing protein [Chloroflexia bacterium]